jgi:hypothetical protein
MAENARHFPGIFAARSARRVAPRLLLLGAVALANACANRPPPQAAAPLAKPPTVLALTVQVPGPPDLDAVAPRLFPPLDGSETLSAGEERDGSQRLIAYGLRVLARPNGALELSREYLPAARTVQSVELPSRLGGGFLFYVLSSSATLFFRAKTFTADLEPFARLEFEADQVVVGFDRLYVLGRRPERFTALDPETGAAIGLGSLPPTPGFGKMAFVDAWFGAIQLPFRGTLVTFDAGSSWRPLGFAATNIEAQDGDVIITSPDGVVALSDDGSLSRREAAPARDNENPVAQRLRQSLAQDELRAGREALARRALKLAVLRGFRDQDGSFVVASAGSLLRVRADDGKIIASDDHAYPGGGECSALHFGQGFGFACSDGSDKTTLFAFAPPLSMRSVRVFGGARFVAASGNGALVIRGGCAERGQASAGIYCIAGKSGDFHEIRVRGDLGVERVVALADGRAAVIVPPRLGAPGFLSLIGQHGQEQRLPLKLVHDATHTDSLLEQGLWLDGFQELPSGALGGWVAGAEPFVGVRVALDGTVSASRPEMSIDRALISGMHALVVGRTGRALETIDGGFDWSDVELPSEFDAAKEPRDEARWQGCSELGCAFAGFVRVGWRGSSAAPRLRIAKLPDVTPEPQPGGSRWLLNCEPTGEASEPAIPLPSRPRGPVRSEDAAPPWAPFLELAAPTLGAGEIGFDTGGSESNSAELHVYAWGERGADWGRAGHAQIRALDRFQVTGGVLESAITHSPWTDATSAAEAFGFDGSGNPTNFRGLLETGQRSGVIVASSRGLLDLLLFEEGRSVTRVQNVARFGLGMLSSVTKLGDAWYASSFNENHAFTLSRIENGRVERLAEYPDVARESSSATLSRAVHGDALGIWVVGRGWYLFPVDPESGVAGAPLYESPADLATMPPACAPDADGFLLSDRLALEPTLHFSHGSEDFAAHRVDAQFIWSARGLCTRALAADTDGSVRRQAVQARAVEAKAKVKVPLAVSERRPGGRRYGFMCAP